MLKKGFGGIIWIAWRKHVMRNFPNLSAAPRYYCSSACDTCVALKAHSGQLTAACDCAVTTTRTCVGLPVGALGGECPCSCPCQWDAPSVALLQPSLFSGGR